MKLAKKLIILTLALIIAIATFPNIAIDVSATAKTQDEAISWVNSQVGKSIDYDGYAGYQCVDLILAYYNYLGVNTVSGNGKDYATNSLPSGWTRTKGGTPKKGDILVYTNGTYGNVGIFESNSVSYHQNIDGKKYVVKTSYKYNSLSDYWGCITPNWGGEEFFSSVKSYDITETNATIKGDFNKLTAMKGAGFYIGTDKNALKKITKNLSGGADGAGSFYSINYTMSKWYGTLTPGTTYYYKLWFTDSNGKEQNSKVYSFKTSGTPAAPTKSTISMSKNRIVAGDSITFTFGSDTATQYSLGIDAQDGTRVLTSGKQAGTTYTYTCNEVGLYSAYVTASNDKGHKDSSRVYFQVISDTPTFVNSVEANGHTYELYLAAITWEDAKVWCEDNGGHLVTITSSDEQAVVENLLGNHKSGCYWFGGEEKTGTYRWVTDELWEYENWPADGSEPNRNVDANGQREQYLGNYHGTTWNDYTNASTTLCGFVMETDPTEEITDVELSADSFIYNGSLQYPEVIARNMAGDVLTEGVDYDVTYAWHLFTLSDTFSIVPGIYDIYVSFEGRYTGEVTKSYVIKEQPLKSSNITLSWTDATYNGAVQKPTIMVKNAEGEELEQDTDYSISYSADSKAPGSYTVTVTGMGNYTGTVKKTYTITKQPLVASNVTLSWTSKAYNGSVQKPTVTVKSTHGTTITEGGSYTLTWSGDCKAAGTYTVTVTGAGKFTGTVKKTFTITSASKTIAASDVTLSWTGKTYNGAVQQPTVTVKGATGNIITEGKSYTVTYSADSKAPGSYTVTVKGMGNYTGTVKKTYTITKQPLVASNITLSWTSKAYNGSVQKPTVTVKSTHGTTITEGGSYTLTWSGDCKAAGTYTVTITGAGKFTGTVKKTFTITAASTKHTIAASDVTLSWTTKVYNNTVQKPTVTVKGATGNIITEGKSYTVSYSDENKKAGTYTITVTGMGNYTGTVKKTYTITKQELDASRVTLSKTSFTYNGSVQQPKVTVKSAADNILTEGGSYVVSYSAGCKAKGTYTVFIMGEGNYTGTITKTFTIK